MTHLIGLLPRNHDWWPESKCVYRLCVLPQILDLKIYKKSHVLGAALHCVLQWGENSLPFQVSLQTGDAEANPTTCTTWQKKIIHLITEAKKKNMRYVQNNLQFTTRMNAYIFNDTEILRSHCVKMKMGSKY